MRALAGARCSDTNLNEKLFSILGALIKWSYVQIAAFCLRIIMDGPRLTFWPSAGSHHPTK